MHAYNHLFISEESAKIPGVGVDQLLKNGKLERLKDGPVFWVDSADSHPCMGTASAVMWTLKCRGRLFHSGLPHKVHYFSVLEITVGCQPFSDQLTDPNLF